MSDFSQRYEYTENNVKKYAPSSGGVYRLIYYSQSKYPVFYVGQSNNLQRRLLEHLAPSEPDECIKRHLKKYTCYFRFAEVPAASRDAVEKQQIDEYTPTCNNR